ncbi:hypothetical protein SAMN05444422_106205 [Halobiforma haloterrestris]|uniref:Uncharacterized protein n=1 Tax=Natronobacterium haloterrestre TaxID=148448 RepID=A0A1I1I206_NATHA|nr:hypothetical protein [Halobiforma haloterrestris]SFC28248.1 hypothetical protein SAMN05444422_106205 [Halobiforma haloterrestris]
MDATGDAPDGWTVETRRTYTPAETDRELTYLTYRHDSGDLRVKVAPAALDGDDHPGYALRATQYPGLEFAETMRVRTVLTFDRCDRIASQFMQLFSARYDGPGTLEDALEYASERTRPHR